MFDQRNLSFAAATVNALGALGVMAKLRTAPGPIRRIHVSRAGDFGRVQLDAADYGRDSFGQVVVARDFGEALQARLDELRSLQRYRPARCIGVEPVQDGYRAVRLATADGGSWCVRGWWSGPMAAIARCANCCISAPNNTISCRPCS